MLNIKTQLIISKIKLINSSNLLLVKFKDNKNIQLANIFNKITYNLEYRGFSVKQYYLSQDNELMAFMHKKSSKTFV